MRVAQMTFLRRTFIWLWDLDTRAVEILFGLFMLGRAVTLSTVPEAMAGQIYNWFNDMAPLWVWAYLFFLAGAAQLAAVLINGSWKRSPTLRMACLALSVAVYTILTVGFVKAGGSALIAAALYGTIALSASWCLVNISTRN